MANKFTKSVLERQAKERRQHPDGQAEGERQAPASTAPGAKAPGGTAAAGSRSRFPHSQKRVQKAQKPRRQSI